MSLAARRAATRDTTAARNRIGREAGFSIAKPSPPAAQGAMRSTFLLHHSEPFSSLEEQKHPTRIVNGSQRSPLPLARSGRYARGVARSLSRRVPPMFRLSVLLLLLTPLAGYAAGRPNVVLILADDLGINDLQLLRPGRPQHAEPGQTGEAGHAFHVGLFRPADLLAVAGRPAHRQGAGPAALDHLSSGAPRHAGAEKLHPDMPCTCRWQKSPSPRC